MSEKLSKEHVCRYVWNVLVKLAKNGKTAHYEDIRNSIHAALGTRYSNQYIGCLLGPIQDHCMNGDKPPLTALVVSKTTGLPGIGFVAEDISAEQYFKEVKERVFAYNWENEPCPFDGYDTAVASVETYAKQLVEHPDTAKEVWRKVKDRGQCQQIFREGLMKAYRNRCAVCGVDFDSLLQAAHIYPWAKASGEDKVSINNGILLCANHHALYDDDFLTISENYEIGCYMGEDCEYNDTTDKDVLLKYVGKKISLPKDKRLWPSPELLKKHLTDED